MTTQEIILLGSGTIAWLIAGFTFAMFSVAMNERDRAVAKVSLIICIFFVFVAFTLNLFTVLS